MNPFQRFVISTVEQFQPKPKNPEFGSVRYSIDSTRVGIQKDFGDVELCSLPQARLDPVVQQCARTIKTMVNNSTFRIKSKALRPTFQSYIKTHRIIDKIPLIMDELLLGTGNLLVVWNSQEAQLEYYSFWQNNHQIVRVVRNRYTQEIIEYLIYLDHNSQISKQVNVENAFWVKSQSSYYGVSPLLVALKAVNVKLNTEYALGNIAKSNFTTKIILSPDQVNSDQKLGYANKDGTLNQITLYQRFIDTYSQVSEALAKFVKSPATFFYSQTPVRADNIGQSIANSKIGEMIGLHDKQIWVAFGLTSSYLGYDNNGGSHAKSQVERDMIAETTINEYLQIIASFINWFMIRTLSSYTAYKGEIEIVSALTDETLAEQNNLKNILDVYTKNQVVISQQGYELSGESFEKLGFVKKINPNSLS